MDNRQTKFHFDNEYFTDPQKYGPVALLQIGDLSCESGYVIGDHEQFCYEISFFAYGMGYMFTNGTSYPIKQGDIYLSLPGERHNGIADINNPFRMLYMAFNFEDLSDDDTNLSRIKRMFDKVKHPVVKDKFDIQTAFINVFNELKNLSDFSSVMINTYLQQIIILSYRSFFDTFEKNYAPKDESDKAKKIVYNIINYIDVNMCKIKEMTQISDALNYSYGYLSHIFTREVGISIKEYFSTKQFERACEWLVSSNMSITMISEKLHYQSIHTFSKAFRRYFGISPSGYREQNKN